MLDYARAKLIEYIKREAIGVASRYSQVSSLKQCHDRLAQIEPELRDILIKAGWVEVDGVDGLSVDDLMQMMRLQERQADIQARRDVLREELEPARKEVLLRALQAYLNEMDPQGLLRTLIDRLIAQLSK